jgi:hypothetical protein
MRRFPVDTLVRFLSVDLPVVSDTKPDDIKRFCVIFVVCKRAAATADSAWLCFQEAALFCPRDLSRCFLPKPPIFPAPYHGFLGGESGTGNLRSCSSLTNMRNMLAHEGCFASCIISPALILSLRERYNTNLSLRTGYVFFGGILLSLAVMLQSGTSNIRR